MGIKFQSEEERNPKGVKGQYVENEATPEANIIWDLSSQLGEAKHKIKMLEWKLDEMKKILSE